MPYIFDRRSFESVAEYEYLLPVASRAANAGANDKVWRLASLNPVYAVAWADGTCSTYAEGGDPEKLRAMAEAVILARPEGFTKGREGIERGGQFLRTVYCATLGEERLVASITSPGPKAARGQRALSSTVYRAQEPSSLCIADGGAPNPGVRPLTNGS